MLPELELEHIKTIWNAKTDESKFYDYKYGEHTGLFSINEFNKHDRYHKIRYFVCFHTEPTSMADTLNEAFRSESSRTLFSKQHDALEMVRTWLPNYLIKLTQ